MNMTDPVADMLTRIRNGVRAKLAQGGRARSKLKMEIARILKDEGYITNFKLTEDDKQGMLRVFLKYGPGMERVITDLQRVSRPGCRIYCGKDEIPRVLRRAGHQHPVHLARPDDRRRPPPARAWAARSSATSGKESSAMSRVGRKVIPVPKDVKVQIDGEPLEVQGPKGKLRARAAGHHLRAGGRRAHRQRARTTSASSAPSTAWRAPWPTTPSRASPRASRKELDIVGVGYKADVEGNKVVFALGYSHPVDLSRSRRGSRSRWTKQTASSS